MTKTKNGSVRLAIGGLLVLAATALALGPAGSEANTEGELECWVDVYNDGYLPEEDGNSPYADEASAIAGTRSAIEQDYAMSRAIGDTESISAEKGVFDARRSLYLQAHRVEADGQDGSEWVWTEDGRHRGSLVLERGEDGWHVHEEHFWVSDGPCGE